MRSIVGLAAVLAVAFFGGTQLTGSGVASYAATADSCTPTDTNSNNTVMTLTEHYYNCHPSTGNALPTGAPLGTIAKGANPAITGHWWNKVAVDGDTGSACQPSTKWLRGSGLNWFSATCTAAP